MLKRKYLLKEKISKNLKEEVKKIEEQEKIFDKKSSIYTDYIYTFLQNYLKTFLTKSKNYF